MQTGLPSSLAQSGQLASNASRSMSWAAEKKLKAKKATRSVKKRVMFVEVQGKFQEERYKGAVLSRCPAMLGSSLNFGADFGFDSKMTKSGKHVELLEMSLVNLKSSVRNDNTSYALAA